MTLLPPLYCEVFQKDPFLNRLHVGISFQVGSLAGAAHLLNNTAGVLRRAQRGQKPLVDRKGKSLLDFDFQYEYKLRKHGLSILYIWVGTK